MNDESLANTPVHQINKRERSIHPMMYLKKIETVGNRAMSIDDAMVAIEKGKNVKVAISRDESGRRTSFGVEHVMEIIVHNEWIIVRTLDKNYLLAGWDDNIRKIEVKRFHDLTDQKYYTTAVAAAMAVKKGHVVQAQDEIIHTGKIECFLGTKKFITRSGSVYEII